MEYGLVAVWWVAYAGLGLFGLPVAARIFSSLPGRGAGFSLALSLTVVTLIAFWVGHLALGWVALLAGLAALAVCAVAAVRAGIAIDRRAAAEALVVFTLVYAGVLVFRSVDPGITPHGEKFLDFGLVASVYRSARLPPEDFWFSGGSLVYYYGGHFLASLLTRLTGTHPWYGFNLSIAGFFGMLASGAYELAGSVAVGRRPESRREPSSARHDDAASGIREEVRSEGGHSRVLAGATAVFFTVCAANVSTAVRMTIGVLPGALRDAAARAFASVHPQIPAYQVTRLVPRNYHYKVAGRIIPETYDPFPLFGIVRGDMRPYLLSTPFLLCAVGVCYAYYRTPATNVRRRRALVFGAIPIVGGFMAFVNTWSLPVVLGVAWLALTFAPADLRSLLPEALTDRVDEIVRRPTAETPEGALVRTAGAAGLAVCVGVLGVVVVLPFFLGPVRARPSTPLLVLAPGERSSLGSLLLVHGAFLAVFVAYLVGRARSRWTDGVAVAGVLWFVSLVVFVPEALAPLALFGLLLIAGWYFLATDRAGFEGVLVVAGLGLVLLAEIVYVAEGGEGRFNTVVKTYMPAWVLWASAAGVIVPGLVRGRGAWSWARRRQQVGSVLAVGLVVSTAVFGGVALRSHFADTDGTSTLDGMTAAEENIKGQVAAIRWLDNRSGRPTVVAAPGRYVYRWSASPAASLTGLPTVAGVSHEAQYRGRRTYLRRVYAVNTIYLGSDDQRAALLDRFDAAYVYVSPTERLRYGDFHRFSTLRGVSAAFRAGNVTIYAVDQQRLRGDDSEGQSG